MFVRDYVLSSFPRYFRWLRGKDLASMVWHGENEERLALVVKCPLLSGKVVCRFHSVSACVLRRESDRKHSDDFEKKFSQESGDKSK